MLHLLYCQMGCPIYSVVGLTNTATDREGRSVPAPGQGILTTARETARAFESPLLKMDFRREQLQEELDAIQRWTAAQQKSVALEVEAMQKDASAKKESAEAYAAERLQVRSPLAAGYLRCILAPPQQFTDVPFCWVMPLLSDGLADGEKEAARRVQHVGEWVLQEYARYRATPRRLGCVPICSTSCVPPQCLFSAHTHKFAQCIVWSFCCCARYDRTWVVPCVCVTEIFSRVCSGLGTGCR